MFHQILHFLLLKEDIDSKGGVDLSMHNLNTSGYLHGGVGNSQLPEQEIQKVIFDQNYLQYLERKSVGEEPGLPGLLHSRGVEKRHIFAQYEMLKSGLKEEFEKKIFTLKNRLT
jgi:hypothetical protein